MKLSAWLPFLIAAMAAVPGTVLRFSGAHVPAPAIALLAGVAILGASFLLLWACDAAQADISQTLALAVVALIAVLPEYAVDMYFTWQAGKQPDSHYAHFAIANMTGANRLLVGVAWGLIAVLFYLRHRRPVRVERERRTELLFLGLATAYALVIPFKKTLAWYDALVFLAIYGWYIYVAGRRPVCECEAEGPAEVLIRLPPRRRRLLTICLFLLAAGTILANAKPFCEGLIATGTTLGINQFLLVQWLAPIASEAPEFTVALVLAWRGKGGLALGSLLSAKLNQWTLLVGMIPAVFALSHGTLQHPIPMDQLQLNEILLTAAQSALAVVLLASMRLGLSGSLLLFGLFVGQLLSPYLTWTFPYSALHLRPEETHILFAVLYVTAAAALMLHRPGPLADLRKGIYPVMPADAAPANATAAQVEDLDIKGPHCHSCRYRQTALHGQSQRQELRQEPALAQGN